jgi:hypothetical protein
MPGAWSDDSTTEDTSKFEESKVTAPEEVDVFDELLQEGGDLVSTDTPDVERRKRARVSQRMQLLMDGTIKVEDLDDEEIIRGQLRDRNGRFTGTKAALIPRAMHDEMMRRVLTRGQEKMRDDYFSAVDTISTIMKDTQVEPAIRLRAADMIITRVAGKPVEKVELSVEVKPWEKAMTHIVKQIPSDIWDAEVVADDDDE